MAPRLSIITPVYDPPLGALRACADSVLQQVDCEWQWCLVDDGSSNPDVRALLAELGQHPQIDVVFREVNGGIVAASNDALERIDGDYVVLLDHDDTIAPGTLAAVSATLADPHDTPIDYLYTDEAHCHLDGSIALPFAKPHWSPERFRSSMYTCHLSVLRTDAMRAVGGFRPGYDGSQDHDLVLRVTETATANGHRIVHLPIMGYLWRNVTSSVSRVSASLERAIENGRRAVHDQCQRLGIDATVEQGPVAGIYRVRRRRPAGSTATLVVATQLRPEASRPHTLAALHTLATIDPHSVDATCVVAYPATVSAEIVDMLQPAVQAGWRLVPVDKPFDISHAISRALLAYPADAVVSIAPGLAARPDLTPDWLDTLVSLALDRGAGLVTGLLCDTSGKVLHAGWDIPEFRMYRLEDRVAGETSVGNDLLLERECTHASLAVAAVSAAQWREAHHFAQGLWHKAGREFSGALLAAGARTLYTPYARFDQHTAVHLGSK